MKYTQEQIESALAYWTAMRDEAKDSLNDCMNEDISYIKNQIKTYQAKIDKLNSLI